MLSDDGLPLEYNVEQMNKFWNQHLWIVFWRLSQIVRKLLPFVLKVTFEKFVITDLDQVERAKEFRNILTELGPTFVKFGQMLSTRPDILPQTVLYELQKLCDSVPSFPTEQALEIIRNELGEDGLNNFKNLHVNTKPIAAASLGQVYKLQLESGEWVALKVQRPDMIRSVSLDLYILRKYAHLVEAVKALLMKTGIIYERRQFDIDLVDCFAKGGYSELDYINEAKNQEIFQEKLVPMLQEQIRIPKVHWDLTSRKVLTTEWIDGKQLIHSSRETINKLVPVGVECFLKQLLEMGWFHADPHPGNLLVDENCKLVLLDFGLCAQVPIPDTKTITFALVHLMDGNISELLEDAIKLGFLPKNVNKNDLLIDLTKIFNESKLKEEFTNRKNFKFEAIESRRKKFHDISKELNTVFFEYPFLVPDYFALITRALIVLEGIAVVGDPTFDIFKSAYPYALQRSIQDLETKELYKLGKKTFF